MRKIAMGLILSFISTMVMAEAEIKTVCHDKAGKNGAVIKGKDGKPVQECKKIKIHKKLEGTEIPADKK
jgi:hypothetical protein